MFSRKEISNIRIKELKSGIYYEGHHIIPLCLGGEGKNKEYKHPNLVLLTKKEHLLAHRLLIKIYPKNRYILYAYNLMSGMKNRKHIPFKRGNTVPIGLTMKGKRHSEQSRAQTSETLKEYYKNNKDKALIYIPASCKYCGYTNKKNIISRYHNENCKNKEGAN